MLNEALRQAISSGDRDAITAALREYEAEGQQVLIDQAAALAEEAASLNAELEALRPKMRDARQAAIEARDALTKAQTTHGLAARIAHNLENRVRTSGARLRDIADEQAALAAQLARQAEIEQAPVVHSLPHLARFGNRRS